MKTLKTCINNLLVKIFGYHLAKYNKDTCGNISLQQATLPNYNSHEFTAESIFNFFPYWVSKFVIENKAHGGYADYTTSRISMLNEKLLFDYVDFKDKTVLEIGPLEGGNTIILEKLQVKQIISIEGHLENYIRCCVIKNIFDLRRTRFYFDDAMNVTREKYGVFDVSFIAGLLYHLDRPHVFLENMSHLTDQLIISTHIAGDESPSADAPIRTLSHDSKTYRGKLFHEDTGPNSGLQSYSFWPFKHDLIQMLNDTGYKHITIIKESTDYPLNYKLLYLIAKK